MFSFFGRPAHSTGVNPFRLVILIGLFSSFYLVARADGINATVPLKIGAQEATNHYDQIATVTGRVAEVTIRPTIVFINLDQPYPNSPLTGVIMGTNTTAFADLLPNLKGKDVEITGTIKKYQDKPEIVLTNAEQLKIVEPEEK